MSFAAIRSSAYSALSASQLRTQVAANNIANADTQGYTAKSATQVSTLSGSTGSGVAIAGITSAVNKYLLADVVDATSSAAASQITADYAQSLQSLMGATSSTDGTGTSLAQMLTNLETTASELVDDPTSDTLKSAFVSALDTAASALREIQSDTQSLRADADQQIADGVALVNEALQSIADLNIQIAAANNRGEATADLEDLRNQALQVVAAQMDVNYYVNSDGAMRLATVGGTLLVGSQANLLSYDPAALVTSDTVFGAISVGGKDITGEIGEGAIGALVTLRDETLPNVVETLDALASALVSQVNDAYGALTGGETLLTGTDSATVAVDPAIRSNASLLSVSSASDAEELADAILAKWSFGDAGGISAGDRTLVSYATIIVSLAASAAETTSSHNESLQAKLDSYQNAMSAATGVNLDEETARLSELEQYYAVASQILSTLNAMFDSLLSVAQSA